MHAMLAAGLPYAAVRRTRCSSSRQRAGGHDIPVARDVAEAEADEVAIVVAPQDVVLAVVVEIAGAGDLPGGVDLAEVGADILMVVHFPDHDMAVVVAPQDVGGAVAVEIADAGDLHRIVDLAEVE